MRFAIKDTVTKGGALVIPSDLYRGRPGRHSCTHYSVPSSLGYNLGDAGGSRRCYSDPILTSGVSANRQYLSRSAPPQTVKDPKRDPPLHRQLKIQNRDTDPKIGVNNRKAQRNPKQAR